jgi:preprotein translocase subunit SecD
MLDTPSWKKILIIVVMAWALIYSVPNLFPQDPAVQIGGKVAADVDEALKERVQGVLEKAKIGFKTVAIEDTRLLVRLNDEDAQEDARKAIAEALNPDPNNARYTVALNLASTVPGWLSAIGAKPMSLGLDLQGGVHFLMEVSETDIKAQNETRLIEELGSLLKSEKLRGTVTRGPDGPVATLRSAADRDRFAGTLLNRFPTVKFSMGVAPSETAFPLVGVIQPEEHANAISTAIDANLTTLRERLNSLGVSEPLIQRQGVSRIAIDLPGLKDTAAAIELIGSTATLEYHAVDESARGTDRVPGGSRIYYDRNGNPIVLVRRVIVSGDQMVNATSMLDGESGTPAVSVTLNSAGAKRMLDFTQDNVGKGMAVVLINKVPAKKIVDGKEVRTFETKEVVINSATIRGVFGAQFQTTGLESIEEASGLARSLKSGSLSAPLSIVEERIIGPSLGKENVQAGLTAVTFSFVFVLVFFIIYYKMFGVITCIALLLNLLLVFAVMSVLGATVTLPGLAAIALTVGMSVDANVLINERIREELRSGMSPLASIVAGYDKASGTIADANVTALLGGVAMFAFGSGPIRGFAVSLCVGILASLYTAVSVSRGISSMIYGGKQKLARLSI